MDWVDSSLQTMMDTNCGSNDENWADSMLRSFPSFLSDEAGERFDCAMNQESAPLNLPSATIDPIRTASVRRAHDRLFGKSKSGAKRRRSPDWKAEEKQMYLELKVEALGTVVGKPDWDYISQGLNRNGFERSAKCCEDLWGTLLKAYKAIREHECFKHGSDAGVMSYWDMGEDLRSRNKLPKAFSMEWCKMMESILAAQGKLRSGKAGQRRSCRRIPHVHKASEDHECCSRLHSNQQSQRMAADHQPAEMSNPGPKESDEAASLLPPLNEQVEKEVNSALQTLPWSNETGGLVTCLSPVVKHLVQKAVSSVLQPVEDEVIMTVLAPFIQKQIADTLNSSLQSVSSALQVREQDDQEYQERLRAIEEKRRALDFEEIQVKRQRVCQQQRSRRTSLYKHVKDSLHTEEVIPILRGLNIGPRDRDCPGPGSSTSIGGIDY